MQKRLLLILILVSIKVNADPIAYSDSLRLEIESENYIVIHFHDWTEQTRDARFEMISTNQDPFTNKNNYAYLAVIDKSTCDTVFKKPTPALTNIQISKDEKYVVGISNIMVWNPFQLVVFNIDGKLVKSRHFSSEEAKLAQSDFEYFKKNFRKQYKLLSNRNRIYSYDGFYYIDFLSANMPKYLGDSTWSYLFEHIALNHLTRNIRESTTNWVDWFNKASPTIKFNYSNESLNSLTIMDPKCETVQIKIRE